MHIGDRVVAQLEQFSGRALGPSGSVPRNRAAHAGDVAIWAIENPSTLEVRHIRVDHLTVIRTAYAHFAAIVELRTSPGNARSVR